MVKNLEAMEEPGRVVPITSGQAEGLEGLISAASRE